MVDDYTAKMTELIELMRLIGNDTQQCEVKECKRKISSTITDTLSAFSNARRLDYPGPVRKERVHAGRGIRRARHAGGAEPGVREKMTPVVRPVIATRPSGRRESGVRASTRRCRATALLHHCARPHGGRSSAYRRRRPAHDLLEARPVIPRSICSPLPI